MIPDTREKLVAINVREADDRDAHNIRMRERLRRIGIPVALQVSELIEWIHRIGSDDDIHSIY